MNNDIQRAISALHSLNNGKGLEWWRLIAGAKDTGIDFETFHTWAEGGDGYHGKRDLKSRWDSAKPGAITEKTFFQMARAAGWQDDSKGNAPDSRPTVPRKPPVEPRKPLPGMSSTEVWERCLPVSLSHEYAIRKQLSDTVLKQLRVVPADDRLSIAGTPCAGYLVVPAYAQDGTLQSLQFVPPMAGAIKVNLPGAEIKGTTLTVGNATDTTVFVESMANADSVWQSTGYEAICCFGSGNIERVVSDYRGREPDKRFVILPDRGKEKEAFEIASKYNCAVALLPESEPDNFDCNDIFCRDGGDVLQKIFDKLIEPPKPDYPVSIVFADELSTQYEPPDELIEGVITAGASSVLYGDSNSGKTFLAIDMACSIARGVEWQGRKVESGAVVYIAAESPGSVRGRLQAYQLHNNCTVPNFAIVQSSINLYRDEIDTNRIIVLVKQIEKQRGVKVRLIIGDTLARLSTGANENSGEMGTVIEGVDRIRNTCDVHVMLIHHSGKNVANGARGWSGVRAAMDSELEITDSATGRCCEVTKQRDLQTKGERIGFRLESVTLGVTKWGKPATSCVVVAGDVPEKAGKRMSECDGAVLEFLIGHKVGIKRGDVAKHFNGRYAGGSIYRAIKSLVTAGAAHEAAGMVSAAVTTK